jgi:nicotinate-nucleotide adenylyltransferase
LVTPCNPLKGNGGLPPLAERLVQARQLARHPRMRISGFEAELGSAYTVDTLAFLRRRHPDVRFVWVMGADGLASFHRWRNWRVIAAMMPFVVVDRPGFRLRAMASPAAQALHRFFIPEERSRLVARGKAPIWTFLTTRLSHISSTEIRAKSKRSRKTG